MTTRETMNQHQVCIEILEGIISFERRKQSRIESINGFAGTFPELRRKYVNDVDTIERCIKRLWKRHDSMSISLMSLKHSG